MLTNCSGHRRDKSHGNLAALKRFVKLTVWSILDTKKRPNSTTGRETLKCTSVWSNLPTIYVIYLVIKNCALNSVPLPEFFNWQHCALSRKGRKVISSFYGLLLKYRGKQYQTLTMKHNVILNVGMRHEILFWKLKIFLKKYFKND